MSTLELAEYTMSWVAYDDGEPTGQRVAVQVDQVRIDEEGDMDGDPPQYHDESQYFIAAAHYVESGAPLEPAVLTALYSLDRWDQDGGRNEFLLLPEEEEALCEHVSDKLLDESARWCGVR